MTALTGEYKAPGAKLVVADVTVEADRFTSVVISGDFFLEPDEALARLSSSLTGLPAHSSAAHLTEVAQRALADAQLMGITAEAVAIAVRRAVGAASRWADHTFDVIHHEPLSPWENLALDQVLLEEVGGERRGPTLRLWEWAGSCAILGSFQSFRNEVDAEAAQKLGIQVVRRISGGGAMFVEPGNSITYSLYVPGSLVEGLSFERSYEFLDEWVISALGELGVNARYVPLNDIASEAGKIGGAAQKRLANGTVLHHVTMSYDIDADKMVQVLRIGREKLSDKGTTSANKRVDPMRRQTGLSRDEIMARLRASFEARYRHRSSELSPQERQRVAELIEAKFSTQEWLHRIP